MEGVQQTFYDLLNSFQSHWNSSPSNRQVIVFSVAIPASIFFITYALKKATDTPKLPDDVLEFKGYNAMEIAAPSMTGFPLSFFR